jgi:hypothetical protein
VLQIHFDHEKNAPYKELFVIFIRHEVSNNNYMGMHSKSLE